MLNLRTNQPTWAGVLLITAMTLGGLTHTPGPCGQALAAPVLQGRDHQPPTPPFNPFSFEPFLERMFGRQPGELEKQLAAVQISAAEEKRFGDQALQAFVAELRQRKIPVVSRGREVNYLRELVAQLRPKMQHAGRYRRITVLLARTSDTDARCFPGGTVVVFEGLLQIVQSEAALVAILGHELSHVDHGHQLRQVKSMKLAQQTFTAQPGNMNIEQMLGNTMFLAQSFSRPFRPEDETQADQDGVRWCYELGYDPLELAKLFLRLDRQSDGRKEMVPEFFRSHPYHRDRYEAIVTQLKQLQRDRPRDDLYVGQRNLLECVPRSKRHYDE